MSKLEKLLFQLIIFLIPTNLAYHFIVRESYISGILSDYLIPKIYISDIPIIFLLIIWSIKLFSRKQNLLKRFKKKNIIQLLVGGFLLLGLRGLGSEKPIAAMWFWLKSVEMILFFFWIKYHWRVRSKKLEIKNLVIPPLSLAMMFQSVLGIYQFGMQKSLAGYWLLGETTLNISQTIAKTNWLGEVKILPYGTTPHPNILGGFLAIGIIILLVVRYKDKYPVYKLLYYLAIGLSLIALALSLSISSWIGFLVGLGCLLHSEAAPLTGKKLLIASLIALGSLLTLGVSLSHWRISLMDWFSMTRRTQLAQIAIQMLVDQPFWGVGLNNFTAIMPSYGEITGTIRFLQPVHNIYLLWLAETGMIGALLLIYLLWKKRKLFSYLVIKPLAIPLLMLLIIGMIDHYPITLQQGQLLTMLALGLLETKKVN